MRGAHACESTPLRVRVAFSFVHARLFPAPRGLLFPLFNPFAPFNLFNLFNPSRP